jgi:tRNA (Thr-GGU) A37 N-methylase
MYPVGYVENPEFPDPGVPPDVLRKKLCNIRLLPSIVPFAYKLDEESYITVIFSFHKAESIKIQVIRRYDGKETGLFASHAPGRLNPIGIQNVFLIEAQGPLLTVRGLDAIHGTPVLDIKAPAPEPEL